MIASLISNLNEINLLSIAISGVHRIFDKLIAIASTTGINLKIMDLAKEKISPALLLEMTKSHKENFTPVAPVGMMKDLDVN